MSENKVIKTSVRNLVEFVLRAGDLVAAFTGSSRLADGAKIHRKLQQAQTSEYQPEVSLAITVTWADLVLQISGRADGVITTIAETGLAEITIDEIKSVTQELETIEAGYNQLHWAQAKCYAYIYAVQHELERIGVQLTYCQAATLETKLFKQIYPVQELAAFFEALISDYAMWAQRLGDWAASRDASAGLVRFPFSGFRPGQRQLSVAVYKTICGGVKLFAQAPTGTGKTMAVIFPAIKALGLGHVEKIFFLTAKTVTRQLAEAAFDRLRQAGLQCKTLTLTAKDKICFRPDSACTPEECPYAAGYYDRIKPALHHCWPEAAFTREVIEQYAREYRVCPFELSLELAFWADAVICDYNYVFDPRVYLKRFFSENSGQYCFLVDEAHNLVDRAREMFSAAITKQSFLGIKKTVNNKLPALAKAAGKINTFLLKLGKLCIDKTAAGETDYFVREQACSEVLPLLRKFMDLAEKWLAKNEQAEFREELLDSYFMANAFLRTAETYDERYVTYAEKIDKDVKLKLFCVNPAELLRQAGLRGRATVFFSATLTPVDYFFEILGGGEGDGRIAVPSPFAAGNLRLLVADHISTTYKTRAQTYDVIVDSITAAITAKTGNYLVFLPSYRYMEEVGRRFCLQNPRISVSKQTGEMTEAERAGFLAQFSADSTETLVGFAVLGGVFGEGIDLTGERLVGAVIVGVGLPKVCLEREIIRQWFNQNNRQGFEYAYVYPGMNKVLQAAGRVIRTEQDRGLVLLIDERFSQARYKRLFPREWQGAVRTNSVSRIGAALKQFWLLQ
ncbi:ATP-dependent DNA helicase [Sporomusa termitida]|uniref:Rad3: DNA repair helicase (Rad3) n=1 Tax=Sporomusa termitida TaxID=2377 RepID=A0A517DYD3_9FIRM|nr:ATP-dependent DNA helicase [Sporomusa termitida]QDR82358.1 rad3: DNA repair helicase (rad3) [Sporomusa termitida]